MSSSSDIASRSSSGSTSSSRKPVNCSGRMVPRSEPEPLTHNTLVWRPRKSTSVDLHEVLPPPQLATDRSLPNTLERYARSCTGLRPLARALSQRLTGGSMGKSPRTDVTGSACVSTLVLIANLLLLHPRESLRAGAVRHWPGTRDTGPQAAPPRRGRAPAALSHPCRRRP